MSVYAIKTKEIKVCEQRFIVSQASTKMGNERYMAITKADTLWNTMPKQENHKLDEIENVVERQLKTYVYPSLVSVTESLDAELPSYDEFYNMPVEEQEVWLSCVKELNPSFFPDAVDTEEKKS